MARTKKQTATEPEVVTDEGAVASGETSEGSVTPEQWTYDAESVTLTVGDRSVSVPLSTPGTLVELCDMARSRIYGA